MKQIAPLLLGTLLLLAGCGSTGGGNSSSASDDGTKIANSLMRQSAEAAKTSGESGAIIKDCVSTGELASADSMGGREYREVWSCTVKLSRTVGGGEIKMCYAVPDPIEDVTLSDGVGKCP